LGDVEGGVERGLGFIEGKGKKYNVMYLGRIIWGT